MDAITRRRFLIASGVTGAGALAAGAAAMSPVTLAGHAETDPLPDGTPVLVVLTLYGGNDGLNTVIPYADDAYQRARPDLAYDEGQVHVLGDGLGLNPALTGLAKLWSEQRLAIVRGVGYPKPDYSHFRAMDIWQTASPSAPATSGWIGRWLDATGDDPVRALNIGSVLPPLAVGTRCTAAALDAGGRGRLAPAFASAVTGLGTPVAGEPAARAAVRTSYRNERTVARTFASTLQPAPGAGTGARGGGHSGQSSGDLSQQLEFVTRCITAKVPTRVYLVSLGGFDTHANEKATQERLLGTLDTAVSSFVVDNAARNVTLMAYSEFGRRVAANASDGTDHGSAGPLFLAGSPVRPGFHGAQPSLTDLDDGNLKFDVDFRAVYGELIDKILGTDPRKVLDTVPDPVGVLRG